MGSESEDYWNEEPPWWKKTLKWLGWLALSLIVAAGFGRYDFIPGVAGFIATWMLRAKLAKPQSETLKFWMIATIAGVGLFLTGFAEPKNEMFWTGFTVSTALLGTLIFFQGRNARNIKEKLQHEIYLMGFDWYRKQKFESEQKEFDEWCKKHPNRHYSRFRSSFLIVLLFLGGCASKQMVGVAVPEPDPNYSNRTLEIHTLPDGAMVDLNGDVAGISPCNLELKNCFQGNWPDNGYKVQILRARWLDGTVQVQRFLTTAKAPSKVAFIHPNASRLLNEQKPKLTN